MLDCSALGHALSPLRPLLSLLFSPLPFLQRENFPLVPKGTSERARYFLKGMANARAPGGRRWTRSGSRLRLVFISAARLGLDRGCF